MFGDCDISEFDLVSDVIRRQSMHFTFWNVVCVCLQNNVEECRVCSVWINGINNAHIYAQLAYKYQRVYRPLFNLFH